MEQSGRHDEPSVSPFRAGITSRCPRCGEGRLFAGYLTLAPRCTSCGLDYSFADSGDGPAVFVILIAGFLVLFGALLVEVFWRPPYWVHAVLWLPLVLITTLVPLRFLKSLLIALQYHHGASSAHADRPAP